jgi:hypothetical protein
LDVGDTVELDEGRSSYEAFDVERGEGDEVVLIVLVDVEDCVTDLLVGSSATTFPEAFESIP